MQKASCVASQSFFIHEPNAFGRIHAWWLLSLIRKARNTHIHIDVCGRGRPPRRQLSQQNTPIEKRLCRTNINIISHRPTASNPLKTPKDYCCCCRLTPLAAGQTRKTPPHVFCRNCLAPFILIRTERFIDFLHHCRLLHSTASKYTYINMYMCVSLAFVCLFHSALAVARTTNPACLVDDAGWYTQTNDHIRVRRCWFWQTHTEPLAHTQTCRSKAMHTDDVA